MGTLLISWEELELTGVAVVVDHVAVLGLQSCFTHSLESKPHPAAGGQLRHDEGQAVLGVPEVDLVRHIVCSVQVEGRDEEEGILVVVRWSPAQRYSGAVPGRHTEGLWNIWI